MGRQIARRSADRFEDQMFLARDAAHLASQTTAAPRFTTTHQIQEEVTSHGRKPGLDRACDHQEQRDLAGVLGVYGAGPACP